MFEAELKLCSEFVSQLSGRILSFRRLHTDLSKHGQGACWEFISGEEVT